MALLESGEMYLESILILSEQNNAVRSIDVSEYMGISKPSVSRAVGLLKDGGYITVNDLGHIRLTDAGREVAERIYERHNLLIDVLRRLGVPEDIASEDACRLEHYMSATTFDAIKAYAEKAFAKD